MKYTSSYDRRLFAAYYFIFRGGRLYNRSYLCPKEEKRIPRWCEQLGLHVKGTEMELVEPSLNHFKKRLLEDLSERIIPRDFIQLVHPELLDKIQNKTDEQIKKGMNKWIESLPN